jgi:6-phosphogluconolactonase (cycloisomerase 2 family)
MREEQYVKVLTRLAPGVAAASVVLGLAAFGAPAALAAPASAGSASTTRSGGPDGAVFVQTDNVAGNTVVAYHRAADGTLAQAGSYPTGGAGGVLAGSVVDHQASQGSLGYDRRDGLLLALNAGSNSVSVFGVSGDRLTPRQVLSSGGAFPVSVTVHGGLVYVLNALSGGSVSGYRVVSGRLVPVPGSTRALGLNPNATPQFTNTPGQVAFTPDGTRLLVTTKANGNSVEVFRVGFGGLLSAAPVVNAEPGAVPFAISFDHRGHVLIAEAGPNALVSFALSDSGALTPLTTALTGQAATCWVVRAGRYFYVSNAGSGSVSGYTAGASGSLSALGNTSTDAGTVDAAAAAGGRFVYVQAGAAGIVDEFSVGDGGALAKIGSVAVPGAAGGEGIAAS